MKFYKLTKDQAAQLEALNKPNVIFCPTGHEKYDAVVGVNDLDAEEFAEHRALLASFKLKAIEE
jgi:molybdate-binding protein